MVECERDVIDWRLLFPKLTREPGFWERLASLVGPLREDPLIKDLTGWMYGEDIQIAQAVWSDVLQPLIQR